MANTGIIQVGQGSYSNTNNSLGIGLDIYVQNMLADPSGTWTSRKGKKIVARLQNTPDEIFFDSTRKEMIVIVGNKLFREADRYQQSFYTGSSPYGLLNFNNRVYFIDNEIIYFWDGVSVQKATYKPNRIMIAPNNISIVNGSPIATIRIEGHNLSVGDFITLDRFTLRMGGQDLNQKVEVTNIVDTDRIEVTYPNNFNETINESGGNGLITSEDFLEVDFPKATSLTELNNRLYLGYGQILYVSSLLTPNDTNVRFAEKTPEIVNDTTNTTSILNLAISVQIDQPFWVQVGEATSGDIKALHSNDRMLFVFKERGVFATEGLISSAIQSILKTDTIVNRKAVASNGSITYFMGYNNVYQIAKGIKALGEVHKGYIDVKDNNKARVVCWDGYVFFVLGNVPVITQLGDYFDELYAEDACLVFQEGTNIFSFLTNFAPNDFESFVGADNKLHLYLHQKEFLVEYTGYLDVDQAIEKLVVSHIRYLTRDIIEDKNFSSVYVFGKRLTDVKISYKVAGATGFEEATDVKTIDHSFLTFKLERENIGRGLIVIFKSMDRSEYVQLEGLAFEVTKTI